jgi:hypothetical protein
MLKILFVKQYPAMFGMGYSSWSDITHVFFVSLLLPNGNKYISGNW